MAKANSPNNSNKTITIPIRVQGRTTSITLKKNVVVLWILFTIPGNNTRSQLKGMVLDFVYHSLDKWKGATAKGLSDFIINRMILELLDSSDLREYNKIEQILADI